MHFAATRPDESLEGLATRVYDLGDKPSEAAVRAATGALADANPFLRELAGVPTGTVVEVPPLEKGEYRPGATHGEDAIAGTVVLEHVQAAAALVARQLGADLDAEAQEARETLDLAGSDDVRKRDTPGLPEALETTVAAAEARAASAKDLRARQDAVLTQLTADLGELTGVHRRGEGAGS
jgi:hypothetical protein